MAWTIVRLGSTWLLLARATVAFALVLGLFTPIASTLCVAVLYGHERESAGPIGAVHICAVLIPDLVADARAWRVID
jgi:hypothetical protein